MTSATKRARWCGGSASRSLTVRLRVASSSTVVHFRVMPRVSHTVDVSTEASLRQAARNLRQRIFRASRQGASVRLLGYVDCLSRVQGDWYSRFCGGGDSDIISLPNSVT